MKNRALIFLILCAIVSGCNSSYKIYHLEHPGIAQNEVFLAVSEDSDEETLEMLYDEIKKGNYETINKPFDATIVSNAGVLWNFELEHWSEKWDRMYPYKPDEYDVTIRRIAITDIASGRILSIKDPKAVPATWPGFWGNEYEGFRDIIEIKDLKGHYD